MNKLIWLGLAATLGMSAVETRAWRQTDFADFEKGSLKRLSLRSDGRLTLAPAVKELLDPSVGYLWACAEDSKGNVYAGGGSTTGTSARLYKIDPSGKSQDVADLEGMEIHAIAVDSKDNVYAATAPDGKVYRVSAAGGKAEVFFDPKAKYIWALVFAPNGDLFIGTGDKGEIFRVTANGQGSVFFKTDEAHARALAVDPQGNLIVGTEPSGLILRVSASGQGFVLHQTAKREVTSVAVARNGAIYAAAVGTRASGGLPPPAPLPAPAPPPPPAAGPGGRPAAPSGPPPASSSVPSVPGGSEIYRIDPDGLAQRVWSHATELAYSIVLDSQDRAVIATGNRGGVYRLEPAQRYTLLVPLAPTQVTQLVASKSSGALYAVTGNIGKVYKIGPGFESEGVFESDLLDAGAFTYWGRYTYEGRENGGRIHFETRSGNLNDAHKNWSAWAAPASDTRIQSPAARFLQYKITLHAASGGAAPEVDDVDLKYQSKNIAPVIEQVEVTPPNYKFPASSTAAPAPVSPASLTLPAIGAKRSKSAGSATEAATSTSSLSFAKGFTGVRWSANDENGDTLAFKVEIRGVKETDWKLLRDKIRERYYSWDSTAFADGEYVVRITASDSPSNTPEESLSATLESNPFWIDNGAPEIKELSARASGAKLSVTFRATDAMSNIIKAEYSLNGGDWIVAEPTTRLSDAKQLTYNLSIDRAGVAGGEYTLAVRVTDEFDNLTVAKATGK